MHSYIRYALPFVPVFNCVFVFVSTNPDGIFCKSFVCITSLLTALFVEGVNETCFVLFWSLILGGLLRRSKAVKKVYKMVYARFAGGSDRSIEFRRGKINRNKSSYGEVIEPPTVMPVQTMYSGMHIDLATSTLLKHAYPTNLDEPIASLVKTFCGEAFAATFGSTVDVDCLPVTSLIANDDAASLEVNINIKVKYNSLSRFLYPRLTYLFRKGPQEREKLVMRMLCELLVKTGKFVRTSSKESAHQALPCYVFRVPASVLDTKRNVLANVFVNDTSVAWQGLLDSACRRLGTCEAQLAFFVRRWAQERGITCARKGHMSTFTWTVLVLYFLRHRSSRDEDGKDDGAVVVDWFVEFISFYTERFLNCQKRISISIDSDALDIAPTPHSAFETDSAVSHGNGNGSSICAKQPSDGSLAERSDDSNRVMPFIENPFEHSCDLAANMDSSNVFRLWEELWRASTLLEDRANVSMVDLLTCHRPA
eukprot:TRINITY_DN10802_c0_g3_i4.p1 TRINITY_DN10802_c0_g3~~TRINITY_DN10802_c0_g3_i4.p1  ORF type:complete len:481 (-),score=39.33 TRINITY_DN10802_c0_g3_i4:232-1674(-)